MTPALDMEQAAAAVGLSWERFRKVWRSLPGFPQPVKRPSLSGKGTYAWRAEAVEDWRKARERAGLSAAPAPANDSAFPGRAAHRSAVQRQRAACLKLMARGR